MRVILGGIYNAEFNKTKIDLEMSKPVRWGKPRIVFPGLNKDNLEASTHQISATIWEENDGHVKFREQFPGSVEWINSRRIPNKIFS